MFSRHFFGAAYWGPAYFGGGVVVVTPAPPSAVDLTEALGTFLAARPELAALTGTYLGAAGARARRPYLTVQEAGAHLEYRSDATEAHATTVRLKVYHDDLDTAGALGDQVASALRGARLSWRGADTTQWVPGDRRHLKEPGQSSAGAYVYSFLTEFKFRVVRPR